jgi:hypothetical protein
MESFYLFRFLFPVSADAFNEGLASLNKFRGKAQGCDFGNGQPWE